MILLDTNIISELMRPSPHESVAQWLSHQPLAHLWISSITVTEILYGLERIPKGSRRQVMFLEFNQFISKGFHKNMKVFDYAAAVIAAQIRAAREARGRPMSMADAQIAAIARVHGFALATRNTKDFESCGLTLINPFLTDSTTGLL